VSPFFKNLLLGLLAATGISALGIYFLDGYLFSDWQARLDKEAQNVQMLENENEQMAWLEPRLAEVREESRRLEEAVTGLQMRLPSQDQFGQMIQDFTSAARERQLSLTIQARPPVKREGIQSGTLDFTVESITAGGYPRVRSFADWLRDYPRLLSFRDFEVLVGTGGQISLRATCLSPVMFDVPLPSPPPR